MLVFTLGFAACGDDDNDEPDNGNHGSGSSTEKVLTIDGKKWNNVVVKEFISSYSDYYFTYSAYDAENGARTFEFHVDSDGVDRMRDVAQDVVIDKLGDISDINLRDMRTQYISGSVQVISIGRDGIELNFRNYQCYYYPDKEGPSSKYKHTINGSVLFSGEANDW